VFLEGGWMLFMNSFRIRNPECESGDKIAGHLVAK